MKTIKGEWNTRRIWIDGGELSPDRSQKVWNHSPDGFNWSYYGSGPAQLALALLLELGVNETEATRYHQDLKAEIVSKLPPTDFELDVSVVENWIKKNIE